MEQRKMRKQAQKGVSSVPPFSPFGIAISRTTKQLKQLSSLPKEKRNKDEFDRDFAEWLRNETFQELEWGRLLYALRALLFKDRDYLEWLRALVEDVSDDLWKLYLRYGILPKPVLDMLLAFVVADVRFDQTSWNRLRSRKARVRDAKMLEKAMKVLEQYEPFLPPRPKESPGEEEYVYPKRHILKWIANQIRDLSPSQRHRPKDLTLILFARELAEYFFSLTGRPLYEYVGKLLVAALPGKWNPTGKIKEATTKLIRAGNGVEDDLRYFAELLAGHVDKAISMSDDYWGKKRKQVDKTTKVSVAKRPRKARGG